MLRKLLAGAFLALLGWLSIASARADNVPAFASCGGETLVAGSSYTLSQDTTGKLCVNATVNASVGGFIPSLSYATLTATASSSASTALPTNTGTVAFQNNTSVAVSCTLASGSATALVNEIIVPAGSTVFLGTTGYDHAACINTTGSASNVIVLAGGSGLGTGFGGGSSGGGGGTVAQGNAGSNAQAWWAQIGDTARGPAKVQAGNSAASTDVALTVADPNVLAAVQSAIPAGTNIIGKVGIDQTTPGTTNGVQVNAALPAGTNTIGNVGSDPSSGKGTPTSVAINVSTATTTQLVAISGTTKIYVTSFDVIAGGTGNITFEYGTGSNCGTGTTALTGAYNLTAQAGIAKGNGVGALLVVPAGNALCVLTSAAVQMSGSVSFQQF